MGKHKGEWETKTTELVTNAKGMADSKKGRARERVVGTNTCDNTRGTCAEGCTKQMYRGTIGQMTNDGIMKEGMVGTTVSEE